MANQVLDRELTRSVTIAKPRFDGRHLIFLTVIVVAAAAVAMAATLATSGVDDTAAPLGAETARWEALTASEYAGSTVGARAAADRLTALAAAYRDHRILTPGQVAEMSRWDAIADRSTRARRTESARLAGLAQHHLTLPPAVQAWASRYQGLANAFE